MSPQNQISKSPRPDAKGEGETSRRCFPRFPINELFLVEANSRIKRCILKNVSAGGVCLVIERPYDDMANFTLRPISGGKEGWPCRTVWEAGSRLGAEFCYGD